MPLLFTSGTARGGTNLRTFMLDQHPAISMAIDPFLPLFRYYRDSLLRSAGHEELLRQGSGALDDYYYSDTKLAVMRAIQEADPDIPFEMAGWDVLRKALVSRLTLTSANLLSGLDGLPAATFKGVFENCQKLVAGRKDGPLAWCGFNDNWAAEFMPALSRLFPDAKFMLHLRDPRGVVSSSEFAEPDPRKRPTVMSFSRHLRKYIALSEFLQSQPSLSGRLLITHYEPLLRDPQGQVSRMTRFLGLDAVPEMLDVSRFRRGDGSLHGTTWPVFQASGDIWRVQLPRDIAEIVEFICAPDMRMLGYEPEIYDEARGLSASAFEFAVRNSHECLGWRTDFAEIEHTIGCELFRRRMLTAGAPFSDAEIARAFLFPALFHKLKAFDTRETGSRPS